MLEITPLLPADLPAAGAVVEAAFANPGPSTSLRRALALDPAHWFCARRDGEIVGTAGGHCYGSCASIGLLAVRPDAQRQGVARRLMRHLIAQLEASGCTEMFLEASAAGAPLYPSLGFVPTGVTPRWAPAGQPWTPLIAAPPDASFAVRDVTPADLPALVACDSAVFGLARPEVIAALVAEQPGRAFLAQAAGGDLAGYLIAGPAAIGPWMAHTPAAAEGLLRAALALSFERGPRITFPGDNHAARELLARYGFGEIERLTHMERNGSDRRDHGHYYGQASLALG